MSGDTVECFNCGHANPSWAQVCRSCGTAIRPDGATGGGPRGIFPTDQASLISIGGTVAAIALAIVLGLFLSRMIPEVATATPSPTPSVSPGASQSVEPGGSGSASASVVPTPSLAGTVTFGTGIDDTTHEVTNPTSSFSAGGSFAHSIRLTAPFGVDVIQEEVTRVAADGGLTVVQPRQGSDIPVQADQMGADLVSPLTTTRLIEVWGTGNFILRVYRGVELLAEGRFTLS